MKARDFPFPSVRISCAKCGRQGRYSRDAFVELLGADTELPDALERISADCPKRQMSAAYDQCTALYPDLVTSLTSALPPKPDVAVAPEGCPEMTLLGPLR